MKNINLRNSWLAALQVGAVVAGFHGLKGLKVRGILCCRTLINFGFFWEPRVRADLC